MVNVFLVDGITRLYLPETDWGLFVWEKLVYLGHAIDVVQTNVETPDNRNQDEKERVHALMLKLDT